MARIPFEEKTNEDRLECTTEKTQKKDERKGVLEYLSMMNAQTMDYNLKYDISLCLEILQGKENMEVKELKEAVIDLSQENEKLVKECDDLQMKILNGK
ncbi:hypothetical protein NERG_00656 [Nematocida ausubeli]|uniref:Uncharacterized protein n=1 Tax=Nematocida ausubeli (strain ATCC PRA-371 / ERTm2) TaxID=1913371 RepID=H8ZAQ7_NEMA1|nr:hypothetical protein NERG_00656 [Nematocida ausubeli]KAI5134040.1 hypothetical protein NEAUS06_0874 [Nematocida ausubeli]